MWHGIRAAIAGSAAVAAGIGALPAAACEPELIYDVTHLDVVEISPRTYTITARGHTTSGGWHGVSLRHMATEPLETGLAVVLDLVGCRPSGPATMMMTPHETTFQGSTRQRLADLGEVLVRAETNTMTARPTASAFKPSP